jgi:hypothetical protein
MRVLMSGYEHMDPLPGKVWTILLRLLLWVDRR